jgi:hypothetical protein
VDEEKVVELVERLNRLAEKREEAETRLKKLENVLAKKNNE